MNPPTFDGKAGPPWIHGRCWSAWPVMSRQSRCCGSWGMGRWSWTWALGEILQGWGCQGLVEVVQSVTMVFPQTVFKTFQCFPRVFEGCPKVAMVFQRFPKVSKASQGFSRLSKGFRSYCFRSISFLIYQWFNGPWMDIFFRSSIFETKWKTAIMEGFRLRQRIDGWSCTNGCIHQQNTRVWQVGEQRMGG